MAKNIKINGASSAEKKLLADFRNVRAGVQERLALFQRMPAEKRAVWLVHDPLMSELFAFAKKITDGKNDD